MREGEQPGCSQKTGPQLGSAREGAPHVPSPGAGSLPGKGPSGWPRDGGLGGRSHPSFAPCARGASRRGRAVYGQVRVARWVGGTACGVRPEGQLPLRRALREEGGRERGREEAARRGGTGPSGMRVGGVPAWRD